MNECPSGIHRLEQSVNSVSQILPLEWQAPSTFYDFHTTTLFQSLVAISQEAPELESLAAAVMKEELQLIEKIHAKDISKSNFITLSRITESLPSLPSLAMTREYNISLFLTTPFFTIVIAFRY